MVDRDGHEARVRYAQTVVKLLKVGNGGFARAIRMSRMEWKLFLVDYVDVAVPSSGWRWSPLERRYSHAQFCVEGDEAAYHQLGFV